MTVKNRVMGALNEIVKSTPDGEVTCVVSHLWVTRSMISDALGLDPSKMNEVDIPMPFGMVMLAGFFFIALSIAYGMGDFELAQMKAKETHGKRVMGAVAEAGGYEGESDTSRLSDLDMPSDKILNNEL